MRHEHQRHEHFVHEPYREERQGARLTIRSSNVRPIHNSSATVHPQIMGTSHSTDNPLPRAEYRSRRSELLTLREPYSNHQRHFEYYEIPSYSGVNGTPSNNRHQNVALSPPLPREIHRPLHRPSVQHTDMQRATVHLISFSHNHVLHHSSISSLLSNLLPPSATHLYTIRAGHFDKPPKSLWRQYTGTHPLIQEHVMKDMRAQNAVRGAVMDLISEVRGAGQLTTDKNRRVPHTDVALSVSCGAGTHRSVAIVERIRMDLEWAFRGNPFSIRVVHVHRSKGDRDPF